MTAVYAKSKANFILKINLMSEESKTGSRTGCTCVQIHMRKCNICMLLYENVRPTKPNRGFHSIKLCCSLELR